MKEGNGFGDSVYNKTFKNLLKNKENIDTGWLLLTSLDKLTKEQNERLDKIIQLLASLNTVKDCELSDNIDLPQICINSLKVPMCALEEDLSPQNSRFRKIKLKSSLYGRIISETQVPTSKDVVA